MNNIKHAVDILEGLEIKKSFSVMPFERKRYVLMREPDWEIVLMTWGPQSKTGIHFHNGSRCWTRLVEGSLKERHFNRHAQMMGEHALVPQQNAYLDDDLGAHQVLNLGSEIAVSLHLYADPITSCHVFDEETGFWVSRDVESEELNGIETNGELTL